MKFNKSSESDTDKLVLEQYKLYMEMLDRSTKRRMDTNTLFISINALMVTVSSLFNKGNIWALCLVCVTGYLFSCIWYVLLCNYNIVNKAKWAVINELEAHLPCDPFKTEYPIMLSQTQPDGQAQTSAHSKKEKTSDIPKLLFCFFRDEKQYRSISILERNLPRVFALIYAVLLIVLIVILIGGFSISASSTLTDTVAEVNDSLGKVNAALAEITRSGLGG